MSRPKPGSRRKSQIDWHFKSIGASSACLCSAITQDLVLDVIGVKDEDRSRSFNESEDARDGLELQ
jgi:hypothetical protein